MKTEEDFKKVTQLVNGSKYKFIRILTSAEMDLCTNSNDGNYLYYKVLGRAIYNDGAEEDIYHAINGVYSLYSSGILDLVFPNEW